MPNITIYIAPALMPRLKKLRKELEKQTVSLSSWFETRVLASEDEKPKATSLPIAKR